MPGKLSIYPECPKYWKEVTRHNSKKIGDLPTNFKLMSIVADQRQGENAHEGTSTPLKTAPSQLYGETGTGPLTCPMLVPLMKDEGSSIDSYEIVKMLHKVRADIEEKNAELEKNPLTHIEVELIELKEELELPECFPPKLLKALLTISRAKEPIQLLVKYMKDLSNVLIDVDVAINEMDDILEGKDTTEMQKNFGPASVEIYQTFKSVLQKWKYSHYKLNNESNELRNCIDVHLEDIKLLAGPLEDIGAALPSLRAVEASVYKAQTNLIIQLKKLDEMKKQRKYLEEHLRERLWKDDASYTVDTQQSMKIQAFFQEELEKYTPLQTDIFLNLHAQDDILQALSDAYDVWKESRKVMADTIQKREERIQELITACTVYCKVILRSKKITDCYEKMKEHFFSILLPCFKSWKKMEKVNIQHQALKTFVNTMESLLASNGYQVAPDNQKM